MTTLPLLVTLLFAPAIQDAAAEVPEPRALEELLEPVRELHNVPALGAAVLSHGELVAIGTVGRRSRFSSAGVTHDDLWHLGSCTKAMTATLIARLVERGVLHLDSTLDELFPEHAETMHEDWHRVTLAMLLQHLGGLEANPMELWEELGSKSPKDARAFLVASVLAAPPSRPPGKFLYSNTGYCIAGAAAERATGKDWQRLMREHVFEPLGMSSAGFGVPGTAVIDQPRGHRNLPDYDHTIPVNPGPLADNPAWMGPAGTVHASLADWGKFVAAQLAGSRGEESPFLSNASFERLQVPPKGQEYAGGWIVIEEARGDGRTLWHNGSNTMWYSLVYVVPGEDLAILVVANDAVGGEPACSEIVAAIRKDLKK